MIMSHVEEAFVGIPLVTSKYWQASQINSIPETPFVCQSAQRGFPLCTTRLGTCSKISRTSVAKGKGSHSGCFLFPRDSEFFLNMNLLLKSHGPLKFVIVVVLLLSQYDLSDANVLIDCIFLE